MRQLNVLKGTTVPLGHMKILVFHVLLGLIMTSLEYLIVKNVKNAQLADTVILR